MMTKIVIIKLVASIISRRMQKYMDDGNLMPKVEKVLQRIKRMQRSAADLKAMLQ